MTQKIVITFAKNFSNRRTVFTKSAFTPKILPFNFKSQIVQIVAKSVLEANGCTCTKCFSTKHKFES